MSLRERLTNESLKGLFKNNFELANYAIRLAKYYVKSGREVNVDALLSEIRKAPHQYSPEELEKGPEEHEEE